MEPKRKVSTDSVRDESICELSDGSSDDLPALLMRLRRLREGNSRGGGESGWGTGEGPGWGEGAGGRDEYGRRI